MINTATTTFRAIAALTALWLALAFFPSLFAQEPTEPAAKGCVLTRLGAVCEGAIRDRGDAYLIEFEGGGSTLVSKIDAEFVGSSRQAVYRYKLERTRAEDVNELLKLADWAGRRQLGSEAIKTLTERLERSTDPAERSAIERKLDDLIQAESFRADAARAIAERESRGARTVDKPTPEKTPEQVELEAWGARVPFATLERFSRKANPVLQKRCASSSCHGDATTSRYSLRPKVLGSAARAVLFANLRATLDYVELDRPEESPILNHPTVVDAKGERVYPFGNDRTSKKDCAAFVEWLESLKKEPVLAALVRETRPAVPARADAAPTEFAPAVSAPGEPTLDSFAGAFDVDSDRSGAAPDDVLRFGSSQEALKYLPKPEDDPNSPEARLRRVGASPQKKYRDEIDPAIFNDRFRPNR